MLPSNGLGSTGISVDADGKIWSANRLSHTATRIDPNGGPVGADQVTRVGVVDLVVTFGATAGRPVPFPYNYSDMTGAQLFNSTAPQGSWTIVQDGGAPGFVWQSISWTATTPPGTSISVEARSAATLAGLGTAAYVVVANGEALALEGQFIQVRVTLRAAADGTSPSLSDLKLVGLMAN